MNYFTNFVESFHIHWFMMTYLFERELTSEETKDLGKSIKKIGGERFLEINVFMNTVCSR